MTLRLIIANFDSSACRLFVLSSQKFLRWNLTMQTFSVKITINLFSSMNNRSVWSAGTLHSDHRRYWVFTQVFPWNIPGLSPFHSVATTAAFYRWWLMFDTHGPQCFLCFFSFDTSRKFFRQNWLSLSHTICL